MAPKSNNSTAYFVFFIVALALLAIGYLVFTANEGRPTDVSLTSEERAWLTDCMKYSHTESCYDRVRTMREWEQ